MTVNSYAGRSRIQYVYAYCQRLRSDDTQGDVVVFKCKTGICKEIPYIDIREQHEGCVMVETVKKNLARFAKKKAEK